MKQPADRSRAGVRAILFDYGGVLAAEGFREGLKTIARRQGKDPEEFFRQGAEAVYTSGYVTGEGTEEDFWRLMDRQSPFQENPAALTADILRRFVLRPPMLAKVRELRRRGYLTAILSDQTDWLDRLEQRDHFFQEFDRVFNSFYLGKGKREPSVFLDTVQALGVEPGQALLIDDNPGNIARAAAMGLQTLLFENQESCLAQLGRLTDPALPGETMA